MRVKVVANELVDTDIEMVSLVRHGANRCPFKVLKSEDSDPETLKDKLQSFFSLSKSEPAVTAYFIRKDAADKLLPILKDAGIDVSACREADGVVVISQGAEVEAKGFVQLGDALALALNHPVKEFSDESVVKAYADSVGMAGFAPGVGLAVNSLAESVWTILNSGEADGSRDDRIAKVDAMLASFRKYITSLAKLLPEPVFKIERAVHAAYTEDTNMRTGKLEEAVAGDLDGLPIGEPKVADPDPTPAPVAKADDAAPADAPAPAFKTCEGCSSPEECMKAAACAKAGVAKAAPVPADDSVLKALEALTAKVEELTKTVESQKTEAGELRGQLAKASEKLAKAEEVRSRTTIVDRGADMDLALSTLGGSDHRPVKRVVKSGEEVWDGLFTDLNTFRPSR